jgi:hypothetical protein
MSTHEPSAAIEEATRKARLDGRREMLARSRLARYGHDEWLVASHPSPLL